MRRAAAAQRAARAAADARAARAAAGADRKSTRLNSSHMSISYAVFCLKKKINGGGKRTLGKLDPELDRHRSVISEARQRPLEAAVAPHGGVQTAREFEKLAEPGAQRGQHVVEFCARWLGQLTVGCAPELKLQRGRHEPLLGAVVFFFNDPATTEIYTLSLHDALPI